MIKSAKYIILPSLTKLFNLMLTHEYFPAKWSLALMVPIFKSGNLESPDNYRGISLNTCLSKLFTMLLNDRLVKLLETRGTIKFNQIGFKKRV